MIDIDTTLKERGNRYGEFDEHARITQAIKAAMVDSPNWSGLRSDMKEALEMVAHKVGRILNGDPFYHDSWHDIIGYTKLVADTLIEKEQTIDSEEQQRQAKLAAAQRISLEFRTHDPLVAGGPCYFSPDVRPAR